MNVLGIDPGFASVGVAILAVEPESFRLVGADVIRTKKADTKRKVRAADDNIERAQEITKLLLQLVDSYQPVTICAESMSFPRNASNAAKMALCWGSIAAIAESRNIPILQVTPQELKYALTGIRSASKEEVQEAVHRLLPQSEDYFSHIPRTQQEHAYDATAAALACDNAEVIRLSRQILHRKAAGNP